MKHLTRYSLAVGLVALLAPLGYGDPPGKAEVVGKSAEDAQSAWSSASKGFTGARDRRGLFNEMRPALKKGMSQAEVARLLGTANAVSQCAGGSLWTYVLNHGCEAQLLFDTTSNLDRAVVLEYPDDQERRGEWKTEGEELPPEIEKESLSGMWRAITSLWGGWYRDKTEIAKRLLGYVEGRQVSDVRSLLGEPDGVLTNGEESIWTYIGDRNNTFLQVFINKNGKAGKVSLRTHDRRTGEINESRSGGSSLSPEEAQLADKAAWQSTGPHYEMTSDRRGIGRRMETYIKTGMTKEEVEKLMGKPSQVFGDGQSCYYDLHTDSSIGIDFDGQGKVSSVRHIGT